MNYKKATELFFGNAVQPVSMTELSKRTGICQKTLYNYKEVIERMPFGRMFVIAKAKGIRPEEIAELFK